MPSDHEQLAELRGQLAAVLRHNDELQRRLVELERSRARNFELYDRSPVGYLTLSAEGQIEEANLCAALMLGVARSNLHKKTITDFIFPTDREVYDQLRRTLLATGTQQSCELRMVNADAAPFWVLMHAVLVRSDECAITLIDIGKRKRAEDSLRAASLYTRTLIESSLDPLVTISPDGTITDVNEASVRVTGIPREQLIGTDFSACFTDPERAREGYLRVFSDGEVHDYPLAIKHRTGQITDVLYNASIYRDEQGKVQGVFAAARDVTARNLALAALKNAHDRLEVRVAERTAALQEAHDQMKKVSFELVWAEEKERERIAGELHDQVGQSLLLAKMKLDALEDQLTNPALHAYAAEAAALVEQSIIDIRTLTFRMRPPILDTAGIETALQWLCSSITNDYHLQVDFFSDDQPKPMSAEVRYSLYQAVRELLLNVVKHARTSHAELSLTTGQTGLTVQVIDGGIGFTHPDAHLKHIENGGYGLYNVQQRIEQMGGRFTIDSLPGRGTSATILVPLTP
jgi:PAS domain S-box-containing protein